MQAGRKTGIDDGRVKWIWITRYWQSLDQVKAGWITKQLEEAVDSFVLTEMFSWTFHELYTDMENNSTEAFNKIFLSASQVLLMIKSHKCGSLLGQSAPKRLLLITIYEE